MQKKARMKATAILLAFCLVLSLVPAPMRVQAVDAAPEQPEQPTYTLQDAIAGIIDYTELYDPLDPATVPEIVGYENAVDKGHVQRLYADEGDNLNKVVFLNADGSKTLYTYDFPVKYIDESGAICDISLEIADAISGYETASGGAITTFSTQATNGIHLSGNDAQITLVPVLPQVTQVGNAMLTATATDTVLAHTAQRVDEKTIEYRYDAKTTIEYSLTYTGFKEDIVVSEYTGQTEYDFRLYTNGLALTEIDGSFYLVDEVGNIKATIGDIIIFTADERNNTFGQLVPTTIVENEQYLLTIMVDADFLSDEKTAYPIRIDPTVELNFDANGAGAIADVTVHSGATSKGTLGSLYVGLKDGSGISRALIKFPGLDLSSLGENVVIETATLTMRDLMCESTAMDIECYVFAGNTWAESTANWTNTNAGSSGSVSTHLCTVTMDYDIGRNFTNKHWYDFNITAAVQGWLDGNYNPEKGIMLKMPTAHENGSTYTYRTIGSYNRSSNKPTLMVNYRIDNTQMIPNGVQYINNTGMGKYIQHTTSGSLVGISGLISTLGNTIQWDIHKVGNGYIIVSASDSTKYLGVPEATSSTSATIVTVSDSAIPARCVWLITYATGGGCIIQNSYNSKYLYFNGNNLFASSTLADAGTSAYDRYVWRIAPITYYGNTSSHSVRELENGFSIDDVVVNIDQIKNPQISRTPANALWANLKDFTFTRISGTSNCVTVSAQTGQFTGEKVGIATYRATHKVTNLSVTFKVYVDRYTYELTNEFGFADSDALLIRALYDQVNNVWASESELERAWTYSRLLSLFVYSGGLWNQLAGTHIVGVSQDVFVEVFGYTEAEYTQLCGAITSQYSAANSGIVSDFAHFHYALATRLAWYLDKDGLVADFGEQYFGEGISYVGGWLGDAVIMLNGATTTTFKNDDYRADLDAENIYHLIIQGNDCLDAINTYYASLTSTHTRADMFLTHISYSTIQLTIFQYLGSNINVIKEDYPDTYNFMCSVRDGLPYIYDYAGE